MSAIGANHDQMLDIATARAAAIGVADRARFAVGDAQTAYLGAGDSTWP
jgi:hypothetical protein